MVPGGSSSIKWLSGVEGEFEGRKRGRQILKRGDGWRRGEKEGQKGPLLPRKNLFFTFLSLLSFQSLHSLQWVAEEEERTWLVFQHTSISVAVLSRSLTKPHYKTRSHGYRKSSCNTSTFLLISKCRFCCPIIDMIALYKWRPSLRANGGPARQPGQAETGIKRLARQLWLERKALYKEEIVPSLGSNISTYF